ncbi:MAG: hypothetical protein BGO31_16945 [Bacteroidetes bacterium 43-16]|nr:MAG: hypothetical protein BGO31_16945 [Bacteroidetes bacterium 43-16]
MNIEFANTIPIAEILSKLGLNPVKQNGHDLWYLSPFRNEKTASFHVNTQKNVWYDHGEGIGGDAFSFVCLHLERSGVQCTPADGLRWFRNMFQVPHIPIIQHNRQQQSEEVRSTVLKGIKPIKHAALIQYLSGRGIPLSVAKTYLQEIRVANTKTDKTFFALAIKNEERGYEYRNLYFKGCVGKKSITFIRGQIPKPPAIHIFEGFMDFLSVITQHEGKRLKHDALILNSLSQIKEAVAYIKGYGYERAYTWLDNDEAGQKATEAFAEFFKTEDNLIHQPMNQNYAPYKDVNAAHMVKLGL